VRGFWTRAESFSPARVNSDRQNELQQFHHQDGWQRDATSADPTRLWPPRTATPANALIEDMWATWLPDRATKCRAALAPLPTLPMLDPPHHLATMRALISTSTSVVSWTTPVGLAATTDTSTNTSALVSTS
jgi:hypothetical protein